MKPGSKKILLDGIPRGRDLRETNKEGRITFEVLVKREDMRLAMLSDVLESEGWILEEDRLILTVPKDALSKDENMIRAVHSAITKMKYLLKVAGMDYEMRMVSEAAEETRNRKWEVAKFKVGIVGDAGVGKTSLIRKFVLDQFDDKYVKTIGAKVSKKEMLVPLPGGKQMRVVMMVWDIMGKRSIADLYMESHFKGMQGILAVCDVTRNETLRSLEGWKSSIFHATGKVPVCIVANKTDLEDQFDFDRKDVAKYSRGIGSPFIFTSAKTGMNVERGFHELAQWILSKRTVSIRQSAGVPLVS